MWIDAIIIAIFLFFLWRGYEKGFLKNVIYLAGWVISLGIAWYAWKPVKTFLDSHLELTSDFTLLIQKKITEITASSDTAGQLSDAVSASGILSIPGKLMEMVQNMVAQAGAQTAAPLAEILSDICLSILAFLVVVMLAKIVTNFFIKIFDTAGKAPVISTVNGLLGMAMGAVKGAIVIMLVLMFLVPVLTVTDQPMLQKSYDNARLTPYLYENNPIFLLWKG